MDKKKVLIIIGFIISILIIGLSVYKIIETSSKVNQDSNGEVLNKNTKIKEDLKIEDEKEKNDNNQDDDSFLNSMREDLMDKLTNKGYKIYLSKCTNQSTTGSPDFKTEYIELSNNYLYKIISKLREAKELEKNITASFFCKKYSIVIGKQGDDPLESTIFLLNYNADINNSNILVIGYNDVGYAFKYEDIIDVEGFFNDIDDYVIDDHSDANLSINELKDKYEKLIYSTNNDLYNGKKVDSKLTDVDIVKIDETYLNDKFMRYEIKAKYKCENGGYKCVYFAQISDDDMEKDSNGYYGVTYYTSNIKNKIYTSGGFTCDPNNCKIENKTIYKK